MDRLACVDVPALPLQILLKRQPDWVEHPVAVVDKDSPQGVVLWVNEPAFRHRVLPGIRYAAGLALTRELRAGVVTDTEIEEEVTAIVRHLLSFTPVVEPSRESPGVFWLDATGLERLHPSLAAWARSIVAHLDEAGLTARIAVGFTRFGTYAAAKCGDKSRLFPRREDEEGFARRVPIDRLDLPPKLRDALTKLGVKNLGDFLALPAAGLRDRFGDEAFHLHRLAADELWTPLEPVVLEEPVTEEVDLGFVTREITTLTFTVRRALSPLLDALARRGQALEELLVTLVLERGGGDDHEERIRPASPTLDRTRLMQLVVLRFEAMTLEDGVEGLRLTGHGTVASREQLELFRENARRDLGAAARAFARLRAAFGEDAVLRARLRDAHLPEARFVWEPLETLAIPKAREVRWPRLIRRIESTAEPIAAPPRHGHDDGWLLGDLRQGPVKRQQGPYVVSGGWWVREVHREYHYAETATGDLEWIYYDRRRRRWFRHGRVE